MAEHKMFVNFTRGEVIHPSSFGEPADRGLWLDPDYAPESRFVRVVAFLMGGPWLGDRVGFYGDHAWEIVAGAPCTEDQITRVHDFVDVGAWAIGQWNAYFPKYALKDPEGLIVPSRRPILESFRIDEGDTDIETDASRIVFRFRCSSLIDPARSHTIEVHAFPKSKAGYNEISLFLSHAGFEPGAELGVREVIARCIGRQFWAIVRKDATDLWLGPDGALQRPSSLDWFSARSAPDSLGLSMQTETSADHGSSELRKLGSPT